MRYVHTSIPRSPLHHPTWYARQRILSMEILLLLLLVVVVVVVVVVAVVLMLVRQSARPPRQVPRMMFHPRAGFHDTVR